MLPPSVLRGVLREVPFRPLPPSGGPGAPRLVASSLQSLPSPHGLLLPEPSLLCLKRTLVNNLGPIQITQGVFIQDP